MKCYYHGEDAVTTCQKCGKGLCRDCIITLGGQSYCQDCFRQYVEADKADYEGIKKRLNIGKILGVIVFVICFTGGLSIIASLIIALWLACCPESISGMHKVNNRELNPGTWDDKVANYNDSFISGIVMAPAIAAMAYKSLKQRKINIDNNEALLAQFENC